MLSRIVVLHILLVVKDQVSGNLSFAAKKSFNIRSSNSKKERKLIQWSNENGKKILKMTDKPQHEKLKIEKREPH